MGEGEERSETKESTSQGINDSGEGEDEEKRHCHQRSLRYDCSNRFPNHEERSASAKSGSWNDLGKACTTLQACRH